MKQATILVVDDEVPIASMLAMLLEDEGYTVRTAHDGETALDAAQRDPPDLVVSDVMMPRLNGIAVALRLRERGIPVILMTAVVQQPNVPGVPCLPKPFDVDHVLAMVDRALDGGCPA